MALVASAIIGGAVISTIGGKQAGDQASTDSVANRESLAQSNADRLAFDREVFDRDNTRYDRDYNRFMDIYGDVEENLGDFYENLTPETLAAAGLESQQQEFARAKENIKTNIAQRRIEGSGLEASVLSQAELSNAEAKAQIRQDAPLKTAQLKQDFVAGRGAPTNAPSGSQVSATMGNNATQAFNAEQNRISQEQANTRSIYSSAGSMLSAGLQAYASDAFSSPSAASGYTVTGGGYTPPPSAPLVGGAPGSPAGFNG